MSYVPAWVKTNPTRFPRAKARLAGGVLSTADTLSLFHSEAPKADAKAFAQLMEHIRVMDEAHSTVIMVQVENEVGLLFDSRDGSAAANQRFQEPVPEQLRTFLTQDWSNLHQDLRTNLKVFKGHAKPGASWEATFGKSAQTDELFMAYYYARYLEQVTAAGKKKYPIPMFTNVCLNYFGGEAAHEFPAIAGGGGKPGDYPSGGGISTVLDIWQHFAPSLDFIAPDIYLNDYSKACKIYRHRNQPLFIPEQRRDDHGARRVWEAYGTHLAIGTSPFGIDTLPATANTFTKHYGLLDSVSEIILDAQRRPASSIGFYFDELATNGSDCSKQITKRFCDYELTIQRCFVFGTPGPAAGMVIHLGDGPRFLLIGWGFEVHARALSPSSTFTGILSFKEKRVVNKETGELETIRVLNGDEIRTANFAMMPSEDPDYGGFPVAGTIPANTMIAELELYSIEEAMETMSTEAERSGSTP